MASCGCGIACEMHRLAPQMVEILSKIADAIGLSDDSAYQRRILANYSEGTSRRRDLLLRLDRLFRQVAQVPGDRDGLVVCQYQLRGFKPDLAHRGSDLALDDVDGENP